MRLIASSSPLVVVSILFATLVGSRLIAKDVDVSSVQRIRDGHRASLDAIRTLHLKYEIRPLSKDQAMRMECEFWKKGDRFALMRRRLALKQARFC